MKDNWMEHRVAESNNIIPRSLQLLLEWLDGDTHTLYYITE